MIFVISFVVTFYFLSTASTVAVSEKASSGRVPLTDQLSLNHLQQTLNTLKKYYYKGREWQALCLALGLTDDTILVIETDHKNVERCLKECLSNWLRKADLVNETGGPNWETLISALRSIGENAAAEEIDKEKQPASIIFNDHRKRMFLSTHTCPQDIATLLHKEEVISDAVFKKVETHKELGTNILLDEVHKVVYKNYKNVQKLAIILNELTATASVGNSILSEYGKKFTDEETESVNIAGGIKIRIPRNYEPKFKELRSLWWTTILGVVNLIKFPASQQYVKDYLYGFDIVVEKPGKVNLLEFIKEKCSLIDIFYLKVFAEHFEIQEAKLIIKRYETAAEEFKNNVPLRLSLNETFYKYPVLKGERITIQVNRKVDDYTLNDIEDLLQNVFETKMSLNVELVAIRESNSFIIICSFPLILTELLTATAVKNIKVLKERGIQQLTIGYVNVYSHDKVHDTCIQESRNVSDLIRKSQLQVSTVQMEAIRHYIEEKSTERNPIVIKDSVITYYWVSALTVICLTTFALLYIMANKSYKRIMEKVSSITDKMERLQSSTSETIDQQLKTLNQDTEMRLLSFKEEILRENSKSSLGLEESLAECKERVKKLHDELTEHLRKEKLAPIM